MYTHNLDPVMIDLGIFSLRWYSLAYIIGIFGGWWFGKKIILLVINKEKEKIPIIEFDNFVTYLIISIIIGGRLGYVFFYNFSYYISNPLEIIQIWKGGMSFHGGLVGVILGAYIFSIKKNINIFNLLDVVACVAPIGLFFGRIANFINGELYGKPTEIYWSVVFPKIDYLSRHPSQIYEAILEGLLIFIVLNFIIFSKKYKVGQCSSIFLILYGVVRIISENFRVPDSSLGIFFDFLSMGSFLSLIMIIVGIITYRKKIAHEI